MAPEMYIVARYFKKKIGLRLFQDIYQKFNYLEVFK
jgi:hypothetical protein